VAPGVTAEPWAAVARPAASLLAPAPHARAAVAVDHGQSVSPAGASLVAKKEAAVSPDSRLRLPTPVLLAIPPAAAHLASPPGIATPRRRSVAMPVQRLPGDGGHSPYGGEPVTVHVTIGRVEVRAAAPAPREHSHRPEPTGPTLADYLRRRTHSAGAER